MSAQSSKLPLDLPFVFCDRQGLARLFTDADMDLFSPSFRQSYASDPNCIHGLLINAKPKLAKLEDLQKEKRDLEKTIEDAERKLMQGHCEGEGD